MNCIPAITIRPQRIRSLPLLAAAAMLLLFGCATAAEPGDKTAAERIYDADFTVTPNPAEGTARIEMIVRQSRHLLREMSMSMPASRYSEVRGDGEISRDGNRVTWQVPKAGGVLSWTANLRHLRDGNSHDAWMDEDWALFRASDIVPPARTRTLRGSQSRTVLQFSLPRGWSSLTRYRGSNDRYRVQNSSRRYDRPTGWILLGKIGVRIEKIAGVQVLIGGPVGQDVRRMDMLAMLNWTLPQVTRLLPGFPPRLTIVSASDGMWYGGLSGPRSLYLHADLPLVSENSTSTLLHEVMHIGTDLSAERGADWIVEGLAEYYALELLRRSRGLSTRRFADAIAAQAEWGKDVSDLCDGDSRGETTARAVALFSELSAEMRSSSSASNPLDDLLRSLVSEGGKVSVAGLRSAATEIHGKLPTTLSDRNLPGCKRAKQAQEEQ